jgi:xanthine dehydrogenase small subunit
VDLISDSPDLNFIEIDNGLCKVGAGTTATDLMESDIFISAFPRLKAHLKLVASSPIRNMATLGGNFVNASPIGDFTAFFLALNAKIKLTKNSDSRSIYLNDFYKGYKDLDKSPDEILSTISFKLPTQDSHFNFEKVSKRIHLDIASVNTAILITISGNEITQAHLSAGGVGPIPMYLSKTCNFLLGKSLSRETVQSALEILQSEISPISDVRGSADYKRLLLRQLFYAHFITLFPNQFSLDSFK